jgi:hypothetical protein
LIVTTCSSAPLPFAQQRRRRHHYHHVLLQLLLPLRPPRTSCRLLPVPHPLPRHLSTRFHPLHPACLSRPPQRFPLRMAQARSCFPTATATRENGRSRSLMVRAACDFATDHRTMAAGSRGRGTAEALQRLLLTDNRTCVGTRGRQGTCTTEIGREA